MKARSVIDAAFAVPGDISRLTGGYAYAREIIKHAPQFGVELHRLHLSATYPYPDDHAIAATRRTFAQLHPDTPLLIDGLAFGAMPPLLADDIHSPIVALVHHPLAYETGIKTADARRFLAFERHALSLARHIVATSPATAKLLQREYGVAEEKLSVAEPGTRSAMRATPAGPTQELLAVGAVIPRKGYLVLIDALSQVEFDDWHLTIVGNLEDDKAHATELREAILRSGMRSRITLTGRMSDGDLADRYAQAKIFVMPSLFEGYGMALTEAMARGLPIVCTTGGAMAETVPDSAALKVGPGNAAALAAALSRLMGDDILHRRLADASWNAGRNLPRWEDCARSITDAIKSVTRAAPRPIA